MMKNPHPWLLIIASTNRTVKKQTMVEIYFVPFPCKTREKRGIGEEGRDVGEPKSRNIMQFSITFR